MNAAAAAAAVLQCNKEYDWFRENWVRVHQELTTTSLLPRAWSQLPVSLSPV